MAVRKALEALEAYVPGEQPDNPGVLKLNTNENPHPPSPRVFEAMAGITVDDLRKYPRPAAAALCQAIAKIHGVSPAQVLVCNGSDEGLALCTRAFCEPRGRVGYLKPSYSLYPVLSAIAELETVEFPLAEDFTWTCPDLVETDLFFLTRPNAPTGMAQPLDEVRRLAERCSGVVVVDEAYGDFADETAEALVGRHDNLLISRSFSKSYSLAGIRMGYLVGPLPLIQALYKIKDSYNTDVLAQRMALAAVQDRDWMRTNVMAVRGTRGRVARALDGRGFQVLPSEANFLFARVPAGKSAEAIFLALRDRQVFVRYFPGERTGGFLRITIGTDAQMDRFLEALDSLLQEG